MVQALERWYKSTFNLEQAFELGQIEIYENIEGTPDVGDARKSSMDTTYLSLGY